MLSNKELVAKFPQMYIKCKVLKSFPLYYGSTTRNSATHSREIAVDTIIYYETEADNGNVWFYDEKFDRAKIEAGSLRNMVNAGQVKEMKGV